MKTISSIASNIQYALLVVQDHMGELSSDYKALVSILEFVRIEEFLPCTRFNFGRPLKDRKFIARAFVAKVVLKHTYTQSLIRELKANKQLRMICGWDEHSKIPLKSQFSRAFKEFAKSNLLEKVHQALIKKTYGDKIVGHLIKDSTPIIAREKALKKVGSSKDRKKMMNKKSLEDKKNGTSRKQNQLKQNLTEMIADLPTACDIGAKKSASGFRVVWKGYKMHVVVDDNCVPIAVITTSASLNDGEVAIPLAEKAKNLVSNFYDLMDSAYDEIEIIEHSYRLGHVPIIDSHSRSKIQKEEKKAERDRKKILGFTTAEEKRYKERMPKERFNALFKDYYGGRNIQYRGHAKVSCHIMFGVLALTATILLKLVQ